MLRIGLVLLVLPCLLLMGIYLSELSEVESCLDSGGSFDYSQSVCDMNTEHPFQPFIQRHMALVNGSMLLAVVGLFGCLGGLYTRAR
ncbi:hypothetical protein [Marinobacterium jannaschii]|uniref:hypothetical protein n=1 Tax=Marinobacterium jannaschii TaxID=64970 RepID=UPI0004801167|nr:hypothetical protein [Marinobacterium jannaschii]